MKTIFKIMDMTQIIIPLYLIVMWLMVIASKIGKNKKL